MGGAGYRFGEQASYRAGERKLGPSVCAQDNPLGVNIHNVRARSESTECTAGREQNTLKTSAFCSQDLGRGRNSTSCLSIPKPLQLTKFTFHHSRNLSAFSGKYITPKQKRRLEVQRFIYEIVPTTRRGTRTFRWQCTRAKALWTACATIGTKMFPVESSRPWKNMPFSAALMKYETDTA